MADFLDIRTLSFITSLFGYIFGIGLIVFNLYNMRFKGLIKVGVAALIMSTGFLFISLREIVPVWISVVVANTFISAAFIFYISGSLEFQENKSRAVLFNYIITGIVLISFIVMSIFNVAVYPRIIVISLAVGVQAFQVGYVLYGITDAQRIPVISIISFPFVQLGIVLFARALWAVVTDNQLESFMSANVVNGVTFVSTIITLAMSSFSFLWITTYKLETELRKQTLTDPLTGLINRRAMHKTLELECSRAVRYHKNLSLIMLDLDNFKLINDEYGHQCGDYVLKKCADFLIQSVRTNDYIVRYGGEEFLIILTETDVDKAAFVAEKLRNGIETLIIEYQNLMIDITASFGVIGFGENLITPDALVNAADSALYTAKNNGRNSVAQYEYE